ncbi:hypothetical protein PRIPAC_78501 [Pristionchus pacificus]|uniref:Transmembrane ion channel n=1 Tax=Pristionchus pacificus TaxID=54126 RepID=A0A2A6BDR2_PRIPA|nr:hypothetical protein PRIPAC_78501 [Pristionchus pacificus]|eukprot:PDM64027.1 transmembrane ion channel [Pristionchus pacificus]
MRFLFLFIFLIFIHCINGFIQSSERLESVYDQLFTTMKNYNSNIPPYQNDSNPVEVEVSMIIEHIDILESSSTFDLQISLAQSWTDPRLIFDGVDHIILFKELTNSIWIPGTYFKEARLIDNLRRNEGRVFELFKYGKIKCTESFKAPFSINYQLQKFPFDKQELLFHLASPYSDSELNYTWHRTNPLTFYNGDHGIKGVKGFKAEDVAIKMTTVQEYRSVYDTHAKSRSTVEVKMILSRYSLPFLLRIFSPITTLVLVSFFRLFIDPHLHSSSRLTIPFIILVSIIFFVNQVSNRIPETPYVKAIDVWLGSKEIYIRSSSLLFLACVSTVFVVLIETIFVIGSARNSDFIVDDKNELLLSKKGRSKISHKRTETKGIDYFSRLIILLAFAIFNITLFVLYR